MHDGPKKPSQERYVLCTGKSEDDFRDELQLLDAGYEQVTIRTCYLCKRQDGVKCIGIRQGENEDDRSIVEREIDLQPFFRNIGGHAYVYRLCGECALLLGFSENDIFEP